MSMLIYRIYMLAWVGVRSPQYFRVMQLSNRSVCVRERKTDKVNSICMCVYSFLLVHWTKYWNLASVKAFVLHRYYR